MVKLPLAKQNKVTTNKLMKEEPKKAHLIAFFQFEKTLQDHFKIIPSKTGCLERKYK